MIGKAYTTKEMKSIVDYLVEHKAYGEIKGRKMWVDFASTQHTNRTWQSLKETFTKRILPDIHNPYYKLSIEQINSFRQGYDVAERNKNKLDTHTIPVDESSTSNAQTQNNKQTSNGNSKEDSNKVDEGVNCSKIDNTHSAQDRSSTETIILDKCYETVEELQRVLESPIISMKKEATTEVIAPSLRDCITYSEPLTPMVQEVLDDFASEPEGSDNEPQLVIVENTISDTCNTEQANASKGLANAEKNSTTDNNNKHLISDNVEKRLLNEIKEFASQTTEEQVLIKTKQNSSTDVQEKQAHSINSNLDKSKMNDGVIKEDNLQADTRSFHVAKQTQEVEEVINLIDSDSNTDKKNTKINDKVNSETPDSFIQTNSGTFDSLLPNNPEGFNKKKSNENENQTKNDNEVYEVFEGKTKSNVKKRTASQDSGVDNKKVKLVNENVIAKVTTNSVDDAKIVNHDQSNDVNIEIHTSNKKNKGNLNAVKHPSTSKEAKEIFRNNDDKKKSAEFQNPCLKNISLFDQDLNNLKYTSSETSDIQESTEKATDKQKEVWMGTTNNKSKTSNKNNMVLMLNSHSETDSNDNKIMPIVTDKNAAIAKKQKEKALAKVFGFSNGDAVANRKRQLSRNKKLPREQWHVLDSDSSEWTSESESEIYVPLPQAHKNKHRRKYLKPKSLRVLSLEEEGGLFVINGKKIYPIVKDERKSTNFATFLPESETNEEESYWKLKYVKEKQKSSELKRLLEQATEPPRNTMSPILESKTSCSALHHQQQSVNNGKEITVPSQVGKTEDVQEKIKIKFTKNNEEVHLEGHWEQINPVLVQVMQIFHKGPEPAVTETKSKTDINVPTQHASGHSTPLISIAISDPVQERVNEIEKEIFREIEELEKEEAKRKSEENVTIRKPSRIRKSLSTRDSPPNLRKKSTTLDTEVPAENANPLDTETENNEVKIETTTRTLRRNAKKLSNETAKSDTTTPVPTRRSKAKLDNSDDDAKYKLPPKFMRQKKSTEKPKDEKPQKSTKIGNIFSSPDNFSLNSMESTQGYQDSDISPCKLEIRKKKFVIRPSYSVRARSQYRRNFKRKSNPHLYCYTSNDSNSLSSCDKITGQNSSVNTDVYKSDSYQLLIPRTKQQFISLEPIDETSPILNKMESTNRSETTYKNNLVTVTNNDATSSSSISLPLSPELSVVENLSVSKEMLKSLTEGPIINETQCNEVKDVENCSNYLISAIDTSVPLMQQDCGLEICNALNVKNNANDASSNVVTESLLNNISTINLGGLTPLTQTLNQKLQNLLLESGNKTEHLSNNNNNSLMEVDDSNIKALEKSEIKKRCSTPQKKKRTKKGAIKVPSVEEEHVEFYSIGGRKSCPPLIQVYPCKDNVSDDQISNLSVTEVSDKHKGRRKKDVIKVKILRPDRKHVNETKNICKMSVCTDSGINGSESDIFLPTNESVELIHNHSETCLHANECVGDNVEFIDKSRTEVSLSSNSMHEWQSQSDADVEMTYAPDVISNNAQDCVNVEIKGTEITNAAVIHNPDSIDTEKLHDSLITEDLSDEIQTPTKQSKWYLLSDEDEETSNINLVPHDTAESKLSNFGANLQQIFPITCAVPNLSTITEMSKDSEGNNSKKPTLNSDDETRDEIFPSNVLNFIF